MSSTKIILSIISLIIIVLGVVVGIFLVKRQQDTRSKAAPSTTLTMQASSPVVDLGENFTVNVNIATGENEVAGVELHLLYDVAKVDFVKAEKGSFLLMGDEVGPVADSSTGTLYYVIMLPPGKTPQQGSGVVATLTFKAKATGTAQFQFDSSKSLVVAIKEGGVNVLVNASSTSVNIEDSGGIGGGDEPTSTPTQPPQETVTPSPTATSSSGGTTQKTATPTPTATSSSGTGTMPPTTELPDTGLPLPTIIGVIAALALLSASALLII